MLVQVPHRRGGAATPESAASRKLEPEPRASSESEPVSPSSRGNFWLGALRADPRRPPAIESEVCCMLCSGQDATRRTRLAASSSTTGGARAWRTCCRAERRHSARARRLRCRVPRPRRLQAPPHPPIPPVGTACGASADGRSTKSRHREITRRSAPHGHLSTRTPELSHHLSARGAPMATEAGDESEVRNGPSSDAGGG